MEELAEKGKHKIMIKSSIIIFASVLIGITSCRSTDTAGEILQRTIHTLDTIETIYFKQDMERTNPRNPNDTINRYREMYFKRLLSDSIVGVQGHWYMYVNDKEKVMFEDIYDGNRLIRINNKDMKVRVYDLMKYPDFKKKPFWGHNTPFGMQFEFKFILENADSYTIDRLKDTVIDKRECYQIEVNLKNKMTMPGFATRLIKNIGNVSTNLYYIDKISYYPIQMKGENFSVDQPDKKIFIEQRYYDIKINLSMDEKSLFNTSLESLSDFKIIEMRPN